MSCEAEIRVRPATHADDLFFFELEASTTWDSLEAADQERLTDREFRRELRVTHDILLQRPGSQVFVAEDAAGQRLGILWYGANRNPLTGLMEAWVYNVTVIPEARGRGIGAILLRHAEELARNAEYDVVGLMVSEHNKAAQRLYERQGFEVTNRVMRKRLPPAE